MRQFHSDSTFFEGHFGGENGRRFSPTSGGGTARRALMPKAPRAEERKKCGRIRVMLHPSGSVQLSDALLSGRVGKSGYLANRHF